MEINIIALTSIVDALEKRSITEQIKEIENLLSKKPAYNLALSPLHQLKSGMLARKDNSVILAATPIFDLLSKS